MAAQSEGRLVEMFGAGTAAVVGIFFWYLSLFLISIYLVIGWDICSIRVIMIGWVLKCVQLSNSMRIFILFVVWSC